MEPMNPYPTSAAPARKTAWIWIIVALVVVLAVAWYYYAYYRAPGAPTGEDAATLKLEQQSSSDELGAIDQDLNATSLEGLDRELSDIDRELAP